MPYKNLNNSLSKLKGSSVTVSAAYVGTQLLFCEGAKLTAHYWRVVSDGMEALSSFDHQQKYGRPAPIDAIKELQKVLRKKTVTEARVDNETGDLHFRFRGNIKFQVFAFSSYEVWELTPADGKGSYYSNFAK